MQQFQFNTVLDGNTIYIPELYKTDTPKSVRITVVEYEGNAPNDPQNKVFTEADFTAVRFPKGFKFAREEVEEQPVPVKTGKRFVPENFTAIRIPKDFKFSREEANER
ncbi:MAG: hypothetical protein LBN42_01190 [Oscillospiraceae bacterium]|jgi:virulence-associated protein VagC|nr:hypothetical protein [Oscillospiraceae bacterium]